MSQDPKLVVVIMAGGAGTRFWPMSIEARPKQFLSLFGERTLLQASYDRVAGLVPPEQVLVLTSANFVDLVREQLPELPEQNVVGEPMRRDTSAAVALAALICRERFGDPVMAVLTSDHLIQPVDEFQSTLQSAARGATGAGGALYTIGILPTYPAEGFGYLHRGALLAEDEGVQHFKLQQFKEKPDRVTAERYLESGEYYWNSGMFIWSTSAILAELKR
jgi:mannose-1-phosphate guanylyltransferase